MHLDEVDENEFFREATLAISSSLEVETALWRSLICLRNFMPAVRISLHVLDLSQGVVETVAFSNPQASVALALKTRLPAASRRILEKNAERPRVRRLERIGDDPAAGFVARQLAYPHVPALLMDLAVEGENVGILALTGNEGEPFAPRNAELLELLQQPFTLALANMLRYRNVLDDKTLLADENRQLQDQLWRTSTQDIVGAEKGLKGVMGLAQSVAPLDSPVLLLGETGVGKELVANAIHHFSARRQGPFIKVNCGAIPENLIDSELFGHEIGAFTGAVARKRGYFERADKGTIFLDEIGELPLDAQVRLLRVLQEMEIERVGGSRPVRVDIRVIAATHRDLRAMLAAGSFREDLYFRLCVFPIVIPPLRRRREDIPDLARIFIRKKSREMNLKTVPSLPPEALEQLMRHQWPGNVRELANCVERALILCRGSALAVSDLTAGLFPLPAAERPAAENDSLNLEEVTARCIRRALHTADGRVEGTGGAADLLGLKPGTLRHRMRKLGIPFGRRTRRARD